MSKKIFDEKPIIEEEEPSPLAKLVIETQRAMYTREVKILLKALAKRGRIPTSAIEDDTFRRSVIDNYIKFHRENEEWVDEHFMEMLDIEPESYDDLVKWDNTYVLFSELLEKAIKAAPWSE